MPWSFLCIIITLYCRTKFLFGGVIEHYRALQQVFKHFITQLLNFSYSIFVLF